MAARSPLLGAFTLIAALLACKSSDKPSTETQPVAPGVAPVAAAGEVTFTRVVPKAGTKATVTRKTNMKFTMSGKVVRETTTAGSVFLVKSSDDFRITRAEIDVKELYTTSQEGTGAEKKSVSPLAGSRYVVTRYDDGNLGAVDGGGSKVASTTLKLIKDEFGGVFEKSNDGAFLPDRPVKLEEKLTPSSDALLKTLGLKDDGKAVFDGAEFFLRKSEAAHATFDTTMTLTQDIGSGMRLRVKFKGDLVLRPDVTWATSVELKGPLTLLDRKGDEKGSGEFSLSINQTFE